MRNRVLSLVLLMAFALISTACNPIGFSAAKFGKPMNSATDTNNDDVAPPVVPPVENPPVVNPPVIDPPVVIVPPAGPILSKGDCAADSSTRLLSCMNCIVPPPVMDVQFSKKGEAFFEIMTAACQVRNGSDPKGYVPPTRAELLYRLNRLSPKLYPDTPMTKAQVSTVAALRSDPATLKKLFGGIFYSGLTEPTIAFETYFGLETREARYTFCYADDGDSTVGEFGLMFTRHNASGISSKAYMDCGYMGGGCVESPAYIEANATRKQLRNAMNESINNPYVPTPNGPQQTCQWEKFEGLAGSEANAQASTWLVGGFKVSADIPSLGVCTQVTGPINVAVDTKVVLAAYRCK